MPTPTERHATYLEALDRQIEFARSVLDGSESDRWTSAHVAALVGRRSILVRHAPALCRLKPCDDPEHYVCDAHPARQWPCDDYRDAAAGLEAESGS